MNTNNTISREQEKWLKDEGMLKDIDGLDNSDDREVSNEVNRWADSEGCSDLKDK